MIRNLIDIFVYDYLPEGFVEENLSYEILDEVNNKLPESVYLLANDGNVIDAESKDNKITVPLVQLREPMPELSYRSIPNQVKILLETFISNTISQLEPIGEYNNITEAIKFAENDVFFSKKLTIDKLVFNNSLVKDDFYEEISSLGFDRRNIKIKSLEDNVVYLFPEPEYTGVLPVSNDRNKIGAMIIKDHICAVKIK